MAKKRKHDSKLAEPSEPPQKQQQQQEPKLEPEPEPVQEFENHEGFTVEEEVYEEEEEEVEEEYDGNQTAKESPLAADANDDDEEPIQNLLEPFSKEQLINLLCEATELHQDVADRIRTRAEVDPVQRKIFVHGLGWDTNTETLISVFKQYGEIEDCKAVADKVSGKSKGYGFILFKKRSGAHKALKEPQKKIGSRITACQLASVGPGGTPGSLFGGSAAGAASQQLQPQTPASEYTQRKIYVSNVGTDLDPQKLLGFFSKFGEIEDGPLGLDKATGKPKGFCLFVYRNIESARKALEEPHKNFEGHVLHCQRAVDGPKPGRQQQHHNTHNKHNRNDNNAGYSGGAGVRHGHLMAPTAAGMGHAAAPAYNPALGQALTAILATQGAGLGLNPALGQALLGTLGAAGAVHPGMPGAGPVMQGAYGNQASINPGMIGGYGNQGGYPNQQVGQGGTGRGQHGYGGAAPYMGR